MVMKPETIRVLAVDDSYVDLRILEMSLQKLGVTSVEKAMSPFTAYQYLSRGVDIAFVDLFIPSREEGFALIEQIRERHDATQLPIVVVSGGSAREDVLRCKQLGISGFLVKPVTPENLDMVMNSVLHTAEPEHQLLGTRLVQKGLITQAQLDTALKFQQMYCSESIPLSVMAMYANLLTQEHLAKLLPRYEFDEDRFEKLVLSEGLLSEQQLQRLNLSRQAHRLRLGEVLDLLGFIQPEALELALQNQGSGHGQR